MASCRQISIMILAKVSLFYPVPPFCFVIVFFSRLIFFCEVHVIRLEDYFHAVIVQILSSFSLNTAVIAILPPLNIISQPFVVLRYLNLNNVSAFV
jgi:hypothetical protein